MAEGVDVDDAAALVGFRNPRSLDVGVEPSRRPEGMEATGMVARIANERLYASRFGLITSPSSR